MPARIEKKRPVVRATAAPQATPAAKPKPRGRPARDELSTGVGSALRRRALQVTGAGAREPKLMLSQVVAGRGARVASTLRTEVRGDGNVNCLERAVQLARPGDQIVLLADRTDDVGHAVVRRRDGSVVDPNAPDAPYASMSAFTTANPRYGAPVTLTDRQAEEVLEAAPGARRDAVLRRLGLDGIADRRVADPDTAAAVREQQLDVQVEEAAAQVAEAYREGGAQAAAAMLNSATIAFEPDVVARINEAAAPTIDAIVSDLREQSGDADGSQSSQGDAQRRFDATVANLSAALGRGASVPRGAEVLERVSADIADAIATDGPGRFDEALGNAVVGGPNFLGAPGAAVLTDGSSMTTTADASLALAVVDRLKAGGKTGEADDILQNVHASLGALNGAAEHLTERVNTLNADLATLVQDWSGLLSAEQLEGAIAAFRESHPEYEQLEHLAGGALRVQDQLAAAVGSGRLEGLDHADDVAQGVERATDTFPDLAGLTDSGQAELARLLREQEEQSGPPGLLQQLGALASQRKKDAGYLQRVGSLLLNNTVATALQASEAGDLAAVSASVRALERQAAVFGVAPDRLRDITSNLEAAATAQTQQAAEDALQRMDLSIQRAGEEGVFASTSGLGQAFRAAGVTLGAAATVGAVATAIDEPSFANVVGALSGAAGTAEAAIGLARGVTRNFELLQGAGGVLRNVGVAAGVIGTGMSVFNAGQALARGDVAQASLFAVQAAGGVAALAGATGVGAVVALGAGLALAQLGRVRASNRFENEHTEAFLQGAGLSADATRHLRNADDAGRSVGPVLAGLARHLNVDPQALLAAVGELEPDRLLQLVEAAHAVDPNDEGVFRSTDESDAQAGTVPPGLFEPLAPRSLEGLVQFMRNQEIDLGELPPAPAEPVRPARGAF